MHRQYKDGGVTLKEYRAYLRIRRNILPHDHTAFHRLKNGEIKSSDYMTICAQRLGLRDYREYLDVLARRRGCADHLDYMRQRAYGTDLSVPASKNKECAVFLGVVVAETLLSKIFQNIRRMPYGNKGFDFICNRGYKIDVKSSCLRNGHNGKRDSWRFVINHNKTADYFIMIAFDDRSSLQPHHIWLIKGTESIKTQKYERMLNDRHSLVVMNSPTSLRKYAEYEQRDKLDTAANICKAFVVNDVAAPSFSLMNTPNLQINFRAASTNI